MDWKSHAIIGVILAVAVAFALGVKNPFELIAVAALGAMSALVPDLDHQTSKGRQVLDMSAIAAAFLISYMSGCGSVFCIPKLEALQSMAVISLALIGAYFVFFALFKPAHRGITHSLTASFVFGVIVYLLFGMKFGVAGFVGYLSHLVADNEIKVL